MPDIFAGFGEVTAALMAFLASHSLPSLPTVRQRLIQVIGLRAYLVVHSVMGTATLIWLVAASLRAPYLLLWGPYDGTRWVPILVMPLALILLTAGLTWPNPFSLGIGAKGFDPARPGVVAITRHPVLWAAALWAFAHLIANGTLRAILLFGVLGGFSLMGTRIFDRRRGLALDKSSNIPFLALMQGRTRLRDWRGWVWRILLGLVLYGLLLVLHGPVIGRSLLP